MSWRNVLHRRPAVGDLIEPREHRRTDAFHDALGAVAVGPWPGCSGVELIVTELGTDSATVSDLLGLWLRVEVPTLEDVHQEGEHGEPADGCAWCAAEAISAQVAREFVAPPGADVFAELMTDGRGTLEVFTLTDARARAAVLGWMIRRQLGTGETPRPMSWHDAQKVTP